MNEETVQAIRFYQKYRFEDQEHWYQDRTDEYEAAQRQAGFWSAVLLVLSALAAALGAANVARERGVWAIAAVALAALGAAVTSYAATYQFDSLARSYGRALDALGLLTPDRPGLEGVDGDLTQYIGRAEAVLLGEVERWGKTTESATPPETAAKEPTAAKAQQAEPGDGQGDP
jgi:SMODS and SLOG-associating 2TM effector domain 1